MGSPPAGAGALVGQRLGSYEIVALLAVGGTAEIYLARIGGAAGFEKYVVVKCLHDHLAEDADFVQMFLDEARLGAQLEHSNIVQTLALGEQGGRYFMVMEFLVGLSLAMIGRRSADRVPGGKVPVPLVLGIAAQSCTGLHYAHEKSSGGVPLRLVHRDISPQNLVVAFEGVVKLVDFGIAKSDVRVTRTQAGTIKGKFAYMAPEQCLQKDVDRRADIFALGVVVHELLTGKRLFKRGSAYDTYQAILECKVPPPSTVNRALDPALDPVVLRALAYEPDDRYPTAEAFGEALIGWLHAHGGHASVGDIARYLEQYFTKEIDEHIARMRGLIEGRESSLVGWDGDLEDLSASDAHDPDEATPVEAIVFPAGIAAAAASGERARTVEVSEADLLGEAVDEDGGEATRIEPNAIARMLAVEAERRGGRLPTDTTQNAPAPWPATAGAEARAQTASGDYAAISLDARRPTTAPEPSVVSAIAIGAPVRTPTGLRDLGPQGFPPAHVPTVITAQPSHGVTGGPQAPQALGPDQVATMMIEIGPPGPMPPTSSPAGTPAGMPPMAELPLPAHLIGLPSYDMAPPEAPRAPMTTPVELAPRRPWLLPLAFLLAVGVALAATIGLARALT
jgi:serine/threonine protein kinase